MLMLYTKAQSLLQSLKDERGQDMVEYAIMTGMIAAAAVLSIGQIGTWVTKAFADLATAIGA